MGATTREMLSRFESLGDENRLRILTLLERHEFTVSELVSVLQLPQSTVSRHLRVLADDRWVRRRQDGKTRYYRLEGALEPGARELWRLTAESLSDAVWIGEDAERAGSVLARRRERAAAFFSETAGGWDALRDDLFGRDARFAPLFGLLDPEWVVGDLGAGTGTLAETIAPFVKRVIAIDRSPEMLEAAATRLEGHDNVDLREGELETLPLADGELDMTVLMLVLHFAVDPGRVLAEAARALAPGGKTRRARHARPRTRGVPRDHGPPVARLQRRPDGRVDGRPAGLDDYRHIPLAPDPNASGPMLFAGTARRPGEPRTTTGRLYI
ncbi:ArsR/SmtB family transcription factor [Candidatus Palauibacter sp.]|uniref:ArsR/SmtB family transcription factor n=1 Tax=Candidatus Palauibacter sp. TaxID=3101350 RepID=UPI003AF293B4